MENSTNLQWSWGGDQVLILFCLFDLNILFFVLIHVWFVFFREKSRIHICPGRLKKERGGVEQSQKSFSVQPPSAHLLQTRQTACFPLHGGVSFHRFSLSFAQNDDGPEASTCPAVLGDVDPCWGVYECVMFTLFALMYIMSKKLKFYFEYRKKEIKPVYCYHIDSFCNFITVWIVLLWQICPFFLVVC